MKRAAILIHGYNVSNPGRTVGKLSKQLKQFGYEIELLRYGYWPFTWQITRVNPGVAKKLAERIEHWRFRGYSVDVFGHSNGATIIRLACIKYGCEIETAVAINPALKVDLHPAPSAELVQVWYNQGDLPVVLGKWLRWLTPWAKKARPWGAMGQKGYLGNVDNVVNFDAGKDFPIRADGHSSVFHEPQSKFFIGCISQMAYNKATQPDNRRMPYKAR